ncbi:uroporphyrinogen-III synthase [Pseudorhizobium tarimense]|uniref:Uroporphyrinogen-III synthase n=1 Tax=Pseudorhizobium tarimense TaxID=1079109 RepID=A0ABV2H9H4_9HYPH|nr:uroporphyrinogen-III synthase [Pseudorhizobium tarimense]MCJ8520193.1 uroporphyrinogen-III synthase [Pseudorhizobium tarimense]
MRVLVTRPADSSRRTAERLSAVGHQPIVLPLTEPEHHPDDVLEALRQLHSAIVLTSAEAVRVLHSLGNVLHPYLSGPVFAVGEATASAARELGFEEVRAADGTAIGMLDLFRGELRALTANHPLLYIAGNPRATTLEDGFADHAIPFETVEGYRMKPVAIDEDMLAAALEAPPLDAVLLYSRATAERFFGLPLRPKQIEMLATARILCLSSNVAEAVPSALQANVTVAARPDEYSLLALLSS